MTESMWMKATAAILPKISAILSICGSTGILAECFYFDRSRLQRVHHRILCLMAIFDILESPWYFASTWALPPNSVVKYAIRNDVTCKAQAFFLQLGVTTIILNACLSWYYVLVICYSWSEEKLREKAAPWMYGTPIILGFGIALAGFPLNLYHPSIDWCWIAPDNADVPTNHYKMFRYILSYVPLYFFTLATVTNTALLVWTVWKVESASRKYASSHYAASLYRKSSIVNKSKARKKLKREQKQVQKDIADMDRVERMVELKRKIEEVRSKNSLQNVASFDTNSVLQLRSKTKEIKNLQVEGQNISSGSNALTVELGDEQKQNETLQNERSTMSKGCDSRSCSLLYKVGVTRGRTIHVASHVPPHVPPHALSQVYKGNKKKSKTRLVAEQSFFYLLAFFLTYGWTMVHQILFALGVSVPYWVKFGHYLFDPMQGLLNYMVYIRPSFLAHRRNHPHLTIMQCLVSLITHNQTVNEDSNTDIENEAKEEIKKMKKVMQENDTKGETATRDIASSGLANSNMTETTLSLGVSTLGRSLRWSEYTTNMTESKLSVGVNTLGESLRCSDLKLSVSPSLSSMDDLPKNEEMILQQFPIGSPGALNSIELDEV